MVNMYLNFGKIHHMYLKLTLPIIQLYKLFEFCDALITKKTSGHLKLSKAWIVRMAQKRQVKKNENEDLSAWKALVYLF